jgi:hypothetical protein
MSRRVPNNNRSKAVKGEVMATSCHVCKAHKKPFNIVESHNFRDHKGRVCCPTMLENICSKCGRKGHFQSKCEGLEQIKEFKPYKSPATKAEEYNAKKENKEKVKATPANAFAALEEDSSDEEEAIKDDPPPANVTLRKQETKKVHKAWVDYDDDDEEW